MPLCPFVAYGDPSLNKWFDRAPSFDPALSATVAQIIAEVAQEGAAAVLRHTQRFDATGLSHLFVGEPERARANPNQPEHIRVAVQRVTDFHELQLETLTEGWTLTGYGWGWRTCSHEREGGRETGMIGQRMMPVKSAGIYVPGGNADYPSSVVMNVVPAKVAGVERIVVATPPNKDGDVSEAVLHACNELGVETVLKAGGASAIAAMALGIEGLERVDVIAGPGNKYVNEAKRQLWGAVGLDCYAGPSEVCVFADDEADPHLAAADLLCQVEHAEDNVGVLLTLSQAKAQEILYQTESILTDQPTADRIRTALRNHGVAIVCASQEEAVQAINRFAPEHLALHCENPASLFPEITNAGAVMMGPWTAQSVADYCEGPSHTLPTSGAARFASPVSVSTFLKLQSVSMLDEEDAKDLAESASAIAALEGLPLHAYAADARKNPPKNAHSADL